MEFNKNASTHECDRKRRILVDFTSFFEVGQIVLANQNEFLLSLLGTCKKEKLSTERVVFIKMAISRLTC